MSHSNLCGVERLKQKIGSQTVRLLDGSWFMPASNSDAHQEFIEARIPGAMFFDIDQVCDQRSSLPHMLPTAEQFANVATELGISNSDEVIVYDSVGLFSAARVWWMFKLFGHDNVRVLDGGLPAWRAAGQEIESDRIVKNTNDAVLDGKKPFKASINETFLVDRNVLIKNIESAEFLVLDARSYGRFTGTQAEPRQGLESGHMPRSVSLPFDQLLRNGRLKTKSELLKRFSEYGLDASNNDTAIVTSCGSGVTAAIITLALNEAGFGMHKLYDGAWAEWASSPDATVLQGAAFLPDNQ